MAGRFTPWVPLIVLLLGSIASTFALAVDTLTFTTLAGSPGAVATSIDATGSAAQFSAPRGIAIDSAGTLYVTDYTAHIISQCTGGEFR